jgi:hypothetical protein
MNIRLNRFMVTLAGATLALSASCRTTCAPRPAAPSTILAEPFPRRFDARQSVVLAFRPHWWWPAVCFTALGYATVDRATGDFAVVGLSPLGVKLFEARRHGGSMTNSLALPVQGAEREIAQAIGTDIASLYFDLLPPPDAEACRNRRRIVCAAESAGTEFEWVFARDTGRLLRKTERLAAGERIVSFQDYRPSPAGDFPARIVLRNRRFGYTLTVRHLSAPTACQTPL